MTGKRLLFITLLVGTLALAGACTQASTPTPTPDNTQGTTPTVGLDNGGNGTTTNGGVGLPFSSGSGIAEAAGYATFAAPQVGGSGYQQSGIWVGGSGKVVVIPDLATITLGVESRQDTANAAREEAATAMAAVMDVLEKHGIEDDDIRTQYFNIQPQYVWNEKTRESEITGYRVTNNLSVKTRDLEGVGTLIDEVANAAGDLVRVNGISFSSEHPEQFASQAREAAVKDAMAKAQQFAQLTGVALGRLVYIAETGGNVPIIRDFAKAEAVAGAAVAAPPTSISPGEMEIIISVQAVFGIE